MVPHLARLSAPPPLSQRNEEVLAISKSWPFDTSANFPPMELSGHTALSITLAVGEMSSMSCCSIVVEGFARRLLPDEAMRCGSQLLPAPPRIPRSSTALRIEEGAWLLDLTTRDISD